MAVRKKTGGTTAGSAKKKAGTAGTKKAPTKKVTTERAPTPTKKAPAIQKPATKAKTRKVITPEERWHMVSEAAYYQAEKRGFAGGNPSEDWMQAEIEIDALLKKTNTVVEA